MNLYEKIVAIMQDVAYLQKDDNVGTEKSSYKAISEEKVTSAVRESMIKNKIVILPVKQTTEEIFTEYEKEAYGKTEKKQRLMTRVDTTYKIINAEKPEESIEVVSSGSGVDSQDKGIGKAMTYAYKYMLLRSFAIPTGNDPDKIHNDELEKSGTITKEKPKYELTIETLKILNETIKKVGWDNKIEAMRNKYNVTALKYLSEEQAKSIIASCKKHMEAK